MESSRGGLSKSFSMRNLGMEEHRLKSQQEFLEREELANGKGATDLLSGYGSWGQTSAALQSESEGSYEVGSSPVFDESFYMGPTQLEAELQATSDAIEEMEGKVAIRLMVAEAVLKGIVRAVEVDASEAVEVSEKELLKVKQELQDKDSTVVKLINTLKEKEKELGKLVEESRSKERQHATDMLTEKERILGKVKESEKYVAQKEKELLKMAEHMVQLSLNLAAESKRVNVLEKQVKESKEAEALKGRELLEMMERTEQFIAEKESIVEMARREARLKELRLTESLAEKETVLSQQLETIRTLKTSEQQLKEELDVRNQKELQLTEALAEKEKVVSQHLQELNALETVEQQLREELDARTQKELQLTQSLDEKVELVSELVRSLESAKEDLKEKLISQSMKVQSLTEELENLTDDLSAKEQQLSKQLETIKSLELAKKELNEVAETQGQKERFLMGELLEKDELICKHLTTITTLESAGQELRKEAEIQRERVTELLQSGKDTSEVLDELRDTVKFHADTIEEKDRSLRFLQDEIEVLNDKFKSSELEGENQREQIVKQEAIIREFETRCQELSLSEKRLQDELVALNGKVRAGLQEESAKSERMKAHICELQSQIDGLLKDLGGKLSRKEEEAMQLVSSVEECKWRSEVECSIILDLVEGSAQTLMESLGHAREEIKNKSEDIDFLRCEVEELSQKVRAQASDISELKMALSSKTQELVTFKTDFVLQNAMQRDALVQEQSQAKEALRKFEELKRMKSTLLDRIQEEKLRRVQLEKALAEQRLKYVVEMDIVSTVMYEAGVTMAASYLERDREVARLSQEQLSGDESKEEDVSTDSTALSMKGKLVRAKMEPKMSRTPLSKLDLLVRENEELRRERELVLTQKTEEIYKLKREFYKELERVKGERKKDYESDGSQKESPKAKGSSKPRHQAFTGPEVKPNDDIAKLEKVVADHERRVSDMTALWDAEKSTLLESLSEKEKEIEELVTNLSLQSQAKEKDESAKLEEVMADYERKVSEMRARWEKEKSVLEGQIQELITNLTQALEKQKECLKRQASLEESLAAVEKERSRLIMFHEEEMESLASGFENALDLKTQKLSEAAKYAEEKAKRVSELDDEVRQVKGEISVLRTEISLVRKRKQMKSEVAEEVQSLIVSLQQLESGVTHRTKQYNLRLQRAQSLLNRRVRQVSLLASNEAFHMQNLQNLAKAEAEVDLLGDEVDALMDVLEKVYTVLSHYHPVIQHYPGLADLAEVVRNEVLHRLRDSDDVSL